VGALEPRFGLALTANCNVVAAGRPAHHFHRPPFSANERQGLVSVALSSAAASLFQHMHGSVGAK
jgi:hypothetical protein